MKFLLIPSLVFFLMADKAHCRRYSFSDGYLDILGVEPEQLFTCDGRPYGYYADVSSGCKIFHVCVPVVNFLGQTEETYQYSFFCGNRTQFSQDSMTCSHPQEAFPCEQSEMLYDLANADFGKIPQREEDQEREGRRLDTSPAEANELSEQGLQGDQEVEVVDTAPPSQVTEDQAEQPSGDDQQSGSPVTVEEMVPGQDESVPQASEPEELAPLEPVDNVQEADLSQQEENGQVELEEATTEIATQTELP